MQEVVAYAETASCRRRFLLHYFGEEFEEERCGKMCDNCRTPKERIEVQAEMGQVIQAVLDLNENYLMKTLIDRDTLYMSADTLTSYKPDSASDVRLLLAYRDVRIFKDNLQGVCDSMSFSTADSIFWFFKIRQIPLLWSDTSQFSGDTIKMLLRNKRLDRIWLRLNALVINSEDEQYFNRIKGRFTTAYFRDNQVNNMYVEGNAEAVYYALDDKGAYIGVNETQCSEMRLLFGDNKVESVKFYTEPKGKFSPIDQAGGDTKKLDGFFWDKLRRPRSVADLLRRREE
ncbi:MAG TPA: RecQ family zinc-binding domain-containing protein, partial [Saprospiraceae bacterium]|nr:RecQ family zinc-binding domain-containing protein [Saprospiraceae bacterium]